MLADQKIGESFSPIDRDRQHWVWTTLITLPVTVPTFSK